MFTRFLQDHHPRADRNTIVEVNDVLIEQANAPARHGLADGPRFIRPVLAKVRVLIASVEVKGSRAERVVDAARHTVRLAKFPPLLPAFGVPQAQFPPSPPRQLQR
jgi:hypothetical protein